MNKEELLDELYPLDSIMSVKNKGEELIVNLRGRILNFKFIPCKEGEELIAVTTNNITMFADYVKLRKDSIFLEQKGGIFTARIGVF